MKYYRGLLGVCVACLFGGVAQGQTEYLPYSYEQYQKYGDLLYSVDTREFTSSKSSFITGRLLEKQDSLLRTLQKSSNNAFLRKIFDEHLVEAGDDNYRFYLDLLPEAVVGRELIHADKRTTKLGTIGAQAGLHINDKFSLYANIFGSQGVFPGYIQDYIETYRVVPGQGTPHLNQESDRIDWIYGTVNMRYDFSDYFQATLAYDKNHIGDGYRSLLLSDFSSNYAHLKLTGKVGNVQYTSILAYMHDPNTHRFDNALVETTSVWGDGKKWGAFQYLDYNATNRLSVGFFQAITWANRNQAGQRGFDFNYGIPIGFMRPVESNNASSPDKMFLGLNAKYKLLDNLTAYGQFLLGEFTAKEFFANNGYIHNKWGAQIGLRGHHVFGVKNLNVLGEYNFVRPYTYQHFASISNYSNHGEPLAHPKGANFRELVGFASYAWNRFNFSLQGTYTLYGTDPDIDINYGGDIFKSYNNHPERYGNKIGQGIRNNLYYADIRASYVLNPLYNLRLEAGYSQRYNTTKGEPTQKSGVVTFGLRSSFRKFYTDI